MSRNTGKPKNITRIDEKGVKYRTVFRKTKKGWKGYEYRVKHRVENIRNARLVDKNGVYHENAFKRLVKQYKLGTFNEKGAFISNGDLGNLVAFSIDRAIANKTELRAGTAITQAHFDQRDLMLTNAGLTYDDLFNDFGITKEEWTDPANWKGDVYVDPNTGREYKYSFDYDGNILQKLDGGTQANTKWAQVNTMLEKMFGSNPAATGVVSGLAFAFASKNIRENKQELLNFKNNNPEFFKNPYVASSFDKALNSSNIDLYKDMRAKAKVIDKYLMNKSSLTGADIDLLTDIFATYDPVAKEYQEFANPLDKLAYSMFGATETKKRVYNIRNIKITGLVK